MANWSSKRQLSYLSLAVILLLVIFGVPVYNKFFNKSPTCFDGIKNQDEGDVDCGGICAKLCKEDSRDPNVLYARFFQSSPGVYSLLANVENANQGVYSKEANYVFRTYDKENVLLDERYGKTYVAPNSTFPVLEYGVFLGERTPAKTTLSFIFPIDWQKGSFKEPAFEVANIENTLNDNLPLIKADLKNREVYEIRNIRVIIVVYDNKNNAIASSQTTVDKIAPKGTEALSFTWSNPFNAPVGRIDIFPRVLPRDIK